MKVWAIDHSMGVSLVSAKTPESALKKVKNHFGSYGAPYSIPKNQEEAISWATGMGAGIIGEQ